MQIRKYHLSLCALWVSFFVQIITFGIALGGMSGPGTNSWFENIVTAAGIASVVVLLYFLFAGDRPTRSEIVPVIFLFIFANGFMIFRLVSNVFDL